MELLISCVLFSILLTVLVATLSQVTALWRKSSSRDDAISQLLKTKALLTRDLTNASGQAGQSKTTTVGDTLAGSGHDGDALTFLSTDLGTASSNWNDSAATGQAAMQSEITYYLYIPNASNPYGVVTPKDGHLSDHGYEQQCAFKWLFRRVDSFSTPPTSVQAWSSLLPAAPPTTMGGFSTATSNTQLIANQMLEFRVLKAAPLWTIQLSAVAVADATRRAALGQIPLASSSFTLTQQFTVPVNN